eukprot:s198_g33.t1
MPDFEGVDLGRAHGKFSDLISHTQELPQCQLGFEDLFQLVSCIQKELDPYGRHFAFQTSKSAEPESHCCAAVAGADPLPPPNGTGALPVVSSRVKWKNPPSFEADAFLTDPIVKAAFKDPEALRKDPKEWPASHPARVRCSKSELLDLAKRWDDLNACMLVPLDDKDFDEAVGLFCVPKDSEHDRLIVNPVTINSRMHTITRSTKELAPGSMLGLLHLEDDQAFRFSADDLTDYYYTFVVSEERGKRNALRVVFQSQEVEHFQCFRPDMHGRPLLICLRTLAMGDNMAVEIAQQAHSNVLKFLCGALKPEETLRYRVAVPRSDFVELLAIDDHVGIQRLPLSQLAEKPKLRDSIVFEKAGKAYKKVGLIQQEKKQRRDQTSGVILGADFDGLVGRVMAPRSRGLNQDAVFCLSRQARCELQLLATLGPVAQSDLRAKHASRLYCTDASPAGGAVCYAEVGSEVTKEFWRHTEQRGFYTKLLNPASAALVEHGIDEDTSKLLAPPPLGPIDSPGASYNIPPPLAEGILFECCEIFKGVGSWTLAHSDAGLSSHDGFDYDGHCLRVSDLSSQRVMQELLALAARRVVREWHAGVPCLSYGTFRRPQVRSNEFPFGFNPDDPFTKYHNQLAQRACFVLTVALMLGAYISIEQPRNSRLFRLHCYRTLLHLGCVISHFAFCSYGSAFHKPSKWLHNKPWLISLESSCNCGRKGSHFKIEGSFTKDSVMLFDAQCTPSAKAVYGVEPKPGQHVAAFSATYPVPLVRCMALGAVAARNGHLPIISTEVRKRSFSEVGEPLPASLKLHVPLWFLQLQAGDPWRFDQLVESSRVPKLAARWLRLLLLLGGDIEPNPGPLKPVIPRGQLDLSTGYAAVTAERMTKCVAGFRAWVETDAGLTWSILVQNPHAVALALRGYGLYCFETGLPRYIFVYAITGMQELYPLSRGYMSLAWQIDRKWQIHEPGSCRPVLPASVVRAAICVAMLWNWHCWAAIVLLGFGAMLHPSEMMALQRKDLIFPADVCHDTESLFVRIQNPKTARFARRQHGRIDDQGSILVVSKVFGSLQANEKLFPGSMSAFRNQWNAIMAFLGVPHSQFQQGATPGVLRGSGATFLYIASEDVSWIAWRGRWARLRTLEHYLQEVGAFVLVARAAEGATKGDAAETAETEAAKKPTAAESRLALEQEEMVAEDRCRRVLDWYACAVRTRQSCKETVLFFNIILGHNDSQRPLEIHRSKAAAASKGSYQSLTADQRGLVNGFFFPDEEDDGSGTAPPY